MPNNHFGIGRAEEIHFVNGDILKDKYVFIIDNFVIVGSTTEDKNADFYNSSTITKILGVTFEKKTMKVSSSW